LTFRWPLLTWKELIKIYSLLFKTIVLSTTNWLFLVIALRQQTPHHIRGGWSHYTDTSEPVDGNGAQKMVTVQSGFQTTDLSITGLKRLPTVKTWPTNWQDTDLILMLNTSVKKSN
jgi:hypothetical protein